MESTTMTRTRNPEPLTVEAATELVFPSALVPISTDTRSEYAFQTGRFVLVGYGDSLAGLHLRALVSYPELAMCCRQTTALEDVANAGAQFAPRIGQDPAAAADAARAKYQRSIAEQLAAADGHELQHAARVFLDGLAAADRAAAERQAAAAEAERIERERVAAAAEQAAKRAAAERERVAAAEQAATTAEAVSAATRENHRVTRARWLAAELEASGIATLRIPSGPMRGRYGQRDLILALPTMSLEQISAVEAALSDAVEKAEAQS
jgi:colicin import membrane protein